MHLISDQERRASHTTNASKLQENTQSSSIVTDPTTTITSGTISSNSSASLPAKPASEQCSPVAPAQQSNSASQQPFTPNLMPNFSPLVNQSYQNMKLLESPPMLHLSYDTMMFSPPSSQKKRYLSPEMNHGNIINSQMAQGLSPQTGMFMVMNSPPQQQQHQLYQNQHQTTPLLHMNTFPSNYPHQHQHHQSIYFQGSMMQRPLTSTFNRSNSSSSSSSSSSQGSNLVLPCYLNREDEIVTQGPFANLANGTSTVKEVSKMVMPSKTSTNTYWSETVKNARTFISYATKIDEVNITIIEIKKFLRRYCISATGKKSLLMERVRILQKHMEELLKKLDSSQDGDDCDDCGAKTTKRKLSSIPEDEEI